MFLSTYPNLFTSDINQALNFYRDLLGGEETFRFPVNGEPEHVELRLGNAVLALSSAVVAATDSVAAPTPGHPFELVVWTEDTDQAVSRLRAAGVPIVTEPEDYKAGNRRAHVTDPDGNWLTIVSRKS